MENKPETSEDDASSRVDPTDATEQKTGFWSNFHTCNVCAIVLLTIGFIAVALYLAPKLIDTAGYKTLAEQSASSGLGLSVKMEDFRLSLMTGPRITMTGLVASDKNGPVLAVKKIYAKTRFKDLIFGTLKLKKLLLEEPRINLVRGKDGSVNVPFIKSGKSKTISLSTPAAVAVVAFESVAIRGGSISWIDQSVGEIPISLKLNDFRLELNKVEESDISIAKISGILDAGSKSTDFGISGTITRKWGKDRSVVFDGRVKTGNFEIGEIWPYLDPHLPFQSLSGQMALDVKLKASSTGGFHSKGFLDIASIGVYYQQAFKGKLRPRDFHISHNIVWEGDSVKINHATAKSGPSVFQISGAITELNSDNPAIDMKMESNKIPFAEFKRFIPVIILTKQQSSFFKKNIEKGSLKLRNLNLVTDLDRLKKMDDPNSYKAMGGTVEIEGFTIVIDGLTRKFRDVTGVVSLVKNSIVIKNATGRYGDSELKSVLGFVDRLNGWPIFNISFKAKLNLEETKDAMLKRLASKELKEQFGLIDSLTGNVEADLNATGDTSMLQESFAVMGKMKISNVALDSRGFGLPLSDLNGDIVFNLKDIKIPRVEWKAGNSQFVLNGNLTGFLSSEPKFDVGLSSEIDLLDVEKIKYVSFGKIYNHSGSATFDSRISGVFQKFDINSTLDMTHAEFRFKNLIHKQPGLSNIYTFSGTVNDRERLAIENLTMKIGDSEIDVAGRISKFIREQGLDLTFTSEGARMEDLERFMPFFEDIDGAGVLKGNFSVKLDEGESKPHLNGSVIAERATFKLPIFYGWFEECDGEFELVGNKISIRNGVGWFGGGKFNLSGGVVMKEKNDFTLNGTSEDLDLYDFFGAPSPKGEDSGVAKDEEDEFEKLGLKKSKNFFEGRWNILISSNKGTIGSLKYQNLETRIIYEDKKYHLEPFTFEAIDGQWSWIADIYKIPKSIKFDSQIKVLGMDMNKYLSQVAQSYPIVTGKLNLDGNVSGNGARWREIKKTFNGKVNASAGAGIFHMFSALSKIFTLLNVSQYFKLRLPNLAVEGMPFDSVTASFSLKDGVAHTRNLGVRSEAMRMSAVGDYDIGHSLVDMKIGVMPFITVDRVISSIPIVGPILTGDNKSLLTSYYLVRGPFNGPEVRSIPVESIADGMFGIIQRVLELPVSVIEGLGKGVDIAEEDDTEN